MTDWSGYYINLDRATERRRRIEAQLERFGATGRYERLPATDGKTVKRRSPKSPGEVGIYHSHLRALELVAISGKPGHVIEDDIVFCDLTLPAIDMTIERGVLDQFDMVFLETYVGETIAGMRIYNRMLEAALVNGPIRKADQLQVLDLNEGYQSGATSYVASPRGAAKIMSLLRHDWEKGPTQPVDMILQDLVRAGRISIGCVFPFVTTVDFETSYASEAARAGSLDRQMLQRLIRYCFFVGRDLQGVAEPELSRLLSRLPPPETGETVSFLARVVQYLLTAPPGFK